MENKTHADTYSQLNQSFYRRGISFHKINCEKKHRLASTTKSAEVAHSNKGALEEDTVNSRGKSG